ncbi:DNA-directed DNA polymerase [Tanacetum coccineum]
MGPKKRTTKASPATTTTTTSVTNAQLKELIDKDVADALAARDADRSMNGDDNHNSGTGVRRNERVVREPKKKMADKYCPRGEIKKLEVELWNLKVKGTDVIGYNQRFQELALLCVRMFPEESNQIERYVCGLPDMIHRSVVASNPKTMQEAIEIATKLIDKKIHTFAEHQTENKRKQDDNNNHTQHQPPKKQGVAIAYTTGSGERKEYAGTLPLCNKSLAATNNQRTPTCYECGNQGHYKSDCPKLKIQNHGNQTGGTRARGMVHALGEGEINQDLNNIEDDTNA